MKDSVCFLDMDGVIADFLQGSCIKFDKPNPYSGVDAPRGPEWYWKVENLFGFENTKDFWGQLGYDFWRNLPKYPDADEIIDICLSNFSQVVFFTSPCKTIGCCDGKIEWAKEHYPSIPLIMTVSCSDRGVKPPKDAVANRRGFMIDDHDDNVIQFEKLGGTAFLVPRPWNRHGHSINSVHQPYASSLVQAIELFKRGK